MCKFFLKKIFSNHLPSLSQNFHLLKFIYPLTILENSRLSLHCLWPCCSLAVNRTLPSWGLFLPLSGLISAIDLKDSQNTFWVILEIFSCDILFTVVFFKKNSFKVSILLFLNFYCCSHSFPFVLYPTTLGLATSFSIVFMQLIYKFILAFMAPKSPQI